MARGAAGCGRESIVSVTTRSRLAPADRRAILTTPIMAGRSTGLRHESSSRQCVRSQKVHFSVSDLARARAR